MSNVILNVPDISCGHCENTVKNALTPLAGVQTVTVNIPARQVQVVYNPDIVSVTAMTEVLGAEEYPVASVLEQVAPADACESSVADTGTACACCAN